MKSVYDKNLEKVYRKRNVMCATFLLISNKLIVGTKKDIKDVQAVTGANIRDINKCKKRLRAVLPSSQIHFTVVRHVEMTVKELGLADDVLEMCKEVAVKL